MRWCLLLAAASETQALATLAAAAAETGCGLEALGSAEEAGLVSFDDHRLEFEHPRTWTWAWWTSRSTMAATGSPKISAQSEKGFVAVGDQRCAFVTGADEGDDRQIVGPFSFDHGEARACPAARGLMRDAGN